MTKEELLKPRYKVIVDYPGSMFRVGEILESTEFPKRWAGEKFNLNNNHPATYPDIFKELAWYEGRQSEEMPRYVAHMDKIVKVTQWRFEYGEWKYIFYSERLKIKDCNVKWSKPATKEEFLAQLKPVME